MCTFVAPWRGRNEREIDEAHERGVNTDLLLGLLSRVVALRRQAANAAAGAAAEQLVCRE